MFQNTLITTLDMYQVHGLVVSFVRFVGNPQNVVLLIWFKLAMNVRNIMSQENGPSDTTSAQNAKELDPNWEPHYTLFVHGQSYEAQLKCNNKTCNKATLHQVVDINTMNLKTSLPENPKRILCCMDCGTIQVRQ